MKTLLHLAIATALLSSASAQAQNRDAHPDPEATTEILAYAPYRFGEGSIEIRRVTEEGLPTIGIKREAKIGNYYRPRAEWARLPTSEQVALIFEDLTGKPLPDNALRALLDFEATRARAEREEANHPSVTAQSAKSGDGKPLCPTHWETSPYTAFIVDCEIKGSIYREASKPDDVCLLTAAIVGSHTQEISYKAANGNFYETHESNVYEGHYVAYEHLTAVKRTRSGKIFNGEAGDKSRYNFQGDFIINLPFADTGPYNWIFSDCQAVVRAD